ncbi:MAG TPA: phage terminase large subunit family protein [Methylomusa anaerophila]|uniref:phage terminase large subunit family protein n=1 Tax=Methylomusa anaerophila TaxID=1930071 RepID=UPI0013157A17|nr:terminase gpA endonuclease subunit [Methylomusa anaerophila]HML88919.1 phage terminase large subunit family protein [Methylomusa anaerophila]
MHKKASISKERNSWPTYIQDALDTFRPPEKLTVSEWTNKFRILDEKSSASPGQWKTERTPYLRRIMDEFCNPEIENITFVAGSQLGKTEAEYNMLCYAIDQDPGPVLVVYPTDKLAEFASENRLQPMFKLSPAIMDKFDERASDKLELQFINNYVALVGANSPSDLATRPVRYIFFDEIDKYPKWAGREANPLSLAEERQKTFYNKKTVKVSTPTIKLGNIWRSYEKADLRLKYEVPCPHCGHKQLFVFKQIKWPEGMSDPQLVRFAAWYECEHCYQRIDDRHKMEMLRSGDWKEQNVPVGRVKSIAFHLNSIYSPWLTFGDVAAKFLSTKENPEDLMNFINSWLAEPWEDKASRMRSDVVLEKQLDYEQGRVYDQAQLLTLGVDVQLNHFWWGVRAWGPRLTSWLVDYGRVETWIEIENIIYRPYPSTLGEVFHINLACIDSGYNTDEVYQFCAMHQDVCLPTKGSSKAMRSRYSVSKLDKFFGLLLYIFDPNQLKDFIAGRLSVPAGEPGSWNGYQGCDRRYADMICSEQKVEQKDKKGRVTYEWQPISSHAQNHMLDVEVNCTLAAEIAGVRYLVEPEPVIAVPECEGRKSNWLRR